MKSKYEFIHELLENRNLKPEQRERILHLASAELEGTRSLDERVSALEKLLEKPFDVSKQLKPKDSESEDIKKAFSKVRNIDVDLEGAELIKTLDGEGGQKTDLPRYLPPSRLKEFLFDFNQSSILRSACHDIDSDELQVITNYCKSDNYSFQKHADILIKEYEKHDKKTAPYAIKTLFRAYFTGFNYNKSKELKWSTDQISVTWSSKSLKDWALKNPGVPPNLSEALEDKFDSNPFEFRPFHSKVTGKSISNFRELVIHFKHLFHIRSDNSLRSIIQLVNENKDWDDQIEFVFDSDSFPSNVEILTDVDKLRQAYIRIIEMMLSYHKSIGQEGFPKVKLEVSESKEWIDFTIHQLNTTYGKSLNSTLERKFGQSYTNLIKKQINGMCDLYLIADYGQQQYARINFWDGEDHSVDFLDEFNGVQHVLRFPK